MNVFINNTYLTILCTHGFTVLQIASIHILRWGCRCYITCCWIDYSAIPSRRNKFSCQWRGQISFFCSYSCVSLLFLGGNCVYVWVWLVSNICLNTCIVCTCWSCRYELCDESGQLPELRDQLHPPGYDGLLHTQYDPAAKPTHRHVQVSHVTFSTAI
jgi:hypothetical protein